MTNIGISGQQLLIFSLGWVGYAVTYFLRKPLGVLKGDMQTELKLTASALGWMDLVLILPYATLQMVFGSLGDRIGAGYTFGLCLILDGLVMCTFGWWSNLYIFMLLLFLNGSCQSLCWANAAKVLWTWFPTGESRGTMFGLFGTSAYAGGFIGTALIVYLQTTYNWRSCFLIPSLIVTIVGVLVVLFYKEATGIKDPLSGNAQPHSTHPTSTSAPTGGTPESGSSGKDAVSHSSSSSSSSSCASLWSLKIVPEVAIATLCVKVVRYSFYSWLPLYLYQYLNYSKAQAGMFSTMFDIGGVFGSALMGVFINKFFKGNALYGCTMGILISTVSLCLFMATASQGIIINSVLLLLSGAFNCGPDTILVSLVAGDLGTRNGRNSAAAVTGLINGFGSFGSVIQGPVIGFILQSSGWNSVLMFIVLTSTVGTAVALRATLLDKPQQHIPIIHTTIA